MISGIGAGKAVVLPRELKTKALIRLCRCTGWCVPLLLARRGPINYWNGNPKQTYALTNRIDYDKNETSYQGHLCLPGIKTIFKGDDTM